MTNAAKKLYIAQPSLTQTVQKMEQRLGVKLFTRSENRMKLTYAGERFAEACAVIVKTCRDVENELEDITKRYRGSVLLGMPFNLGSYIFPLLYLIYRREYPETKLVPIEGSSVDLENMLTDRTIDIAIMPLPVKSANLDSRIIFEERMVLSIPADNPLNERAVAVEGERYPHFDLRLAGGEPFVMSLPGQRVRLATERIFKQAGISPKVVFVTKSVETKKRMSAAGFGLAIFPEHYLSFYSVPTGANYYYLDRDLGATWSIGAVFRTDGFISHASAECLSILTRLFEEHKPN